MSVKANRLRQPGMPTSSYLPNLSPLQASFAGGASITNIVIAVPHALNPCLILTRAQLRSNSRLYSKFNPMNGETLIVVYE